MRITLRPHGQRQRSGRFVVGKRLLTIGLCLVAIGLGQHQKSGPGMPKRDLTSLPLSFMITSMNADNDRAQVTWRMQSQ